MQDLYEELITIHKAIIHFHGLQQQIRDFFKWNVQATIFIVQEWTMRHKGELLSFLEKMKPQVELEKARVQIQIQNNKKLDSLISSIHASYVRLYNNLDFMVKIHKIPSIGSLTESKRRHQFRQEIEEYLEQLQHIATKEGLEMNRQNMQNYIVGPIQIRTMLLLLQRDVKTGSKLLYLDSMEARVRFQPDTIM